MNESAKDTGGYERNLRMLRQFLDVHMHWRYALELYSSGCNVVGEVVIDSRNNQRHHFQFNVLHEGVFFVLAYPFAVPLARNKDVCELVVRINNRMWDGKFDYLIENGRVQFRLFQEFNGSGSKANTVRLNRLVQLPAHMLKRFRDAFDAVIKKEKTPTAALEGCFPRK